MWTATFWKATLERAAKSAAQAFVLYVGPSFADAWSVNWKTLGGLVLGAAALSVAMSLVSAKLAGDPDSPSLVSGEK